MAYYEIEFTFNGCFYIGMSDGALWKYIDGIWVCIEKTEVKKSS